MSKIDEPNSGEKGLPNCKETDDGSIPKRQIAETSRRFASIIIPTLNEEFFLPRLFENIKNNTFDPTRLEIIVSDSGSQDNTEKVAKMFAAENKHLDVKFVKAPTKGVAIARNHGIEHAEGDDLLLLDADSQIPGDFIANALGEMEERKLDIAGCYATPDSSKWYDRLTFWVINLQGSIVQYTSHPLIAGGAMLVTKELHKELKGFNPGIRFGEDLDYANRATEITQYRMLRSAKFVFSMRRFDSEGRWTILRKTIIGQLHYNFGHIKNASFEYEFGKFGEPSENRSPGEKKEPEDKEKT